jgi:hypothetical protein
MKNTVIEFFQNLPKEKHEQFNEAFKLYRDSPSKNLSIERSLNAGGYSERALENLLYDLQKMHGITDVEKVSIKIDGIIFPNSKDDGLSEGYKKYLEVKESLLAIDSIQDLIDWGIKRQDEFQDVDYLLGFAITDKDEEVIGVLTIAWESLGIDTTENENVKKLLETKETEKWDSLEPKTAALFASFLAVPTEELKGWMDIKLDQGVDLKSLLEISDNAGLVKVSAKLQICIDYLNSSIPSSENDDLLKVENEALKEEVETLKLAPKIDNQSIRVEFPFLNNTDCPDEFKILIADKITAWKRYLELQADIAKAESGENTLDAVQLALIAQEAVKCFDENQKIYDELNCYQTTCKILGVHPVFKRLQMTREVETMTTDELIKYKGSSAKFLSVNKGTLAKAKKDKDTAKILEIETRVAERQEKLFLVNKKLGV